MPPSRPRAKARARLPLHLQIAVPVALIIAGALALSGAAVVENMRVGQAVSQIFQFVTLVRSEAAAQKGFAVGAGEDLFAELQHAGQILSPAAYVNPWEGQIAAVTLSASQMRFETGLPARDCRRLALDLLARGPDALGLLAIEAQPATEGAPWMAVYEPSPPRGQPVDLARAACGDAPYARLALVFRTR